MSAADVTPEFVAKLRDDISAIASRGLRGMLEDTLSLLDVLESAWRERDALRAEVERLRQGQAVEVLELTRACVTCAQSGHCIQSKYADACEDYIETRSLSLPAPSAVVVTVPRDVVALADLALKESRYADDHPARTGLINALRSAPPANEGKE